ncbi:hypothetical protein B4168_1330 [Anoxybacillus flavithermus]|nr:hypothetical protein B4168_1330 [Anoxybacillus flavithermus]OAO83637.1 hypothetical protein GT23_4131 [Parageobacillus thermoglucosidasius]
MIDELNYKLTVFFVSIRYVILPGLLAATSVHFLTTGK